MKLHLVLILAVLGWFALICLAAEPDTTGAAVAEPTGRENFVMPKLFDFEAFKQKFHRHYPSALENLRRAKVFMARAWAVFISAVKYTHRRSTKFLKLNPYSDWTKEEREALMNNMETAQTRQAEKDESLVPAADPEEVERLLAEIEAHKADDPDFAAIAEELEQGQKRSRRSVDAQPERQLSMELLMGGDESGEKNEGGEQPKPISPDEAAQIDKPSDSYLYSVLGSIKNAATNFLATDKNRGESVDRSENQGNNRRNELLEVEWTNLPDEIIIDLRKSGCIGKPKEQTGCGACYAFALTSLFEYHYCMQTGKLVAFSEQYMVDCGYNIREGGCKGGSTIESMRFLGLFGVERAVDYPYVAKKQKCPYEESTILPHMGRFRLSSGGLKIYDKPDQLTPAAILEKLTKYGPLATAIKVSDEFFDFGGGIDVLNCDPEEPTGHLMSMVGYGRSDGFEYYIMRNSFGPDYGVNGYYHLHTKIRTGCLVRVGYIMAKFEENDLWARKSEFDHS